MTAYGNRGMSLETAIEYTLNRYRSAGVAIITKQHTKFIPIRNRKGVVVSCKVEEKATVDFMGRYGALPVAFEAKNTNTGRIRFDEVQPHQATFLDEWTAGSNREDGFQAFGMVVVAFNKLDTFYAVPWPFWRAARDAWRLKGRGCGKEQITWSGVTWETPGKASVSPEELLPEWEIKINSRYGLDLMSVIDSYLK